MAKQLSFLFLFTFAGLLSFAQIREIPKAVQDAFEKQYPQARGVDFQDNLTSVHVHFVLDSAKMVAKYTNKGAWKETEKEWGYNKLFPAVQDGFEKSKYADWKVDEVAVIYLPGGAEQYRIRAVKSDLQKKYLYFNKEGRLLRDALTL
ncbi:MAG TPA: PepSY-like domain-containing protein [Flavisolibacter sp.]|jgi:hypothetical protein|nr:PepSY-like domain-containing protein [Flavisolibacter sp.]